MTRKTKNTFQNNRIAKKKGAKKQARKNKSKTNTGASFELRAQRAMQFIHQGKEVEHNEILMASYGVQRQFDVSVRSEGINRSLERLFEAKDYQSKVPFEKVEAFETKLRELEDKPHLGGGMISRSGFQSGPIDRAKKIGDSSLIKKYYQLRELEENDWEGHFKKFSIQGTALSPVLFDVEVSPNSSANKSEFNTKLAISIDRSLAFLYDDQNEVKLNLLDLLNQEIQKHIQDVNEECVKEYELELPERLHLKIQNQKMQAALVRYKLKYEKLSQEYVLDFSEAFSDYLKDCISNEDWFIPDTDKRLHATVSEKSTIFSFTEKDKASLSMLVEESVSTHIGPDQFQGDLKSISKSIFLQLLLSLSFDKKRHIIPNKSNEYTLKLNEAIDDQISGRIEEAKKKYWELLGQATCLEALINLAVIYQHEERNQSMYLIHRACELFPDQVEGFVAMIEILLLDKKITDAIEVYKVAKILHAFDYRLMEAHAKILIEEKKMQKPSQNLSK